MSVEPVLARGTAWRRCEVTRKGRPGCVGIQLDHGQPCFAHHADKNARAARLKQLKDGGLLDFVKGVEFTEELLATLFLAAPSKDGRIILRGADFRSARFQGGPAFQEVTFLGDAKFDRATFLGDAIFNRAIFRGDAKFTAASFQNDAQFNLVSFFGDALFDRISFGQPSDVVALRSHWTSALL
jgi:Pentapeptide repeats (9 copies)